VGEKKVRASPEARVVARKEVTPPTRRRKAGKGREKGDGSLAVKLTGPLKADLLSPSTNGRRGGGTYGGGIVPSVIAEPTHAT